VSLENIQTAAQGNALKSINLPIKEKKKEKSLG